MREEIPPTEYNSICLDVATIKTTMERVLDHHVEFKVRFDTVDKKLENVMQLVHEESNNRRDSIEKIKDELHGRINTILFSILGGASMFIVGIIMWLVQNHKN